MGKNTSKLSEVNIKTPGPPLKPDVKPEPKKSQTIVKPVSQGVTKVLVDYLVDFIDKMTEQICQRVPSIPTPIRAFCKALYDTIVGGGSKNSLTKIGAYRLIASFLVEQWLTQAALEETVEYGLVKAYYIEANSHENFKLISYIINKLFRMDEVTFEDINLQPFNKIFDRKKNRVVEFYKELIEIPKVDPMP
jgi:hypothetical protein